MKKLITLALAAVVMSNAQAQLSIAPVAGLNVSGYTVKIAGTSYNDQVKLTFGPTAGALMNIPLGENLSLQPGLIYKMNGYRTKVLYGHYGIATAGGEMTVTLRVNTIELPATLAYSFNTRKGSKFFVGAGPYLAMNMSASSRMQGNYTDASGNPIGPYDHTEKVEIGPHDGEIERFDAGGGVRVGYCAVKGLLICLQGQYGFMNLGTEPSSFHNYNFGVVAGYSFKLKKHKTAATPSAGTK